MSKKWVITALASLLLVGLAACGSGQNETSNNNATAVENTQKENAAGNNSEEATATTKKMQDEFGEVEIPMNPQRIAGLYVEDYLKALGVTPVVQWYNPMWGKQDYLKLDVPTFNYTGQVEALLNYDPDLIIVDGGADKVKYDQFAKIAPTYRLQEDVLDDPKETLLKIGEVLGMEDKAREVVQAYDQKVADGKAKLQAAVGTDKVAVLRINVAEKTIALFGVKNRFTGIVFSQFGLTPIPLAASMEEYQQVLSPEFIPQLEADRIIIFPSNGGWDSAENADAFKLLDDPLFKSLPAVKNGHVYKMDRTYWQSGAILSNQMKLDDLLKAIVKE
ncbi:ABC transporter substrate-binding protein [Paenibacillus herberti]|uniref:Ferrichrome ABC transporter substrate-binding protein n=1 Tax=Paenibacillus herberti TaxID=1619309 RepID=A0A229NV09_9BACL|nr:ABC transporter substrate-binding protein [Paenibacillus herberti]OXM13449.1 ferrichrome ABC transporter substrate-binding protein [Paenibacillus herberti]